MSVINIKNKFYLLVAILLISCNNYYNFKQISIISDLQSKTEKDQDLLNLLPILDLNNTLKIARLNLSKIEEKKLDSIAIELIYFESNITDIIGSGPSFWVKIEPIFLCVFWIQIKRK